MAWVHSTPGPGDFASQSHSLPRPEWEEMGSWCMLELQYALQYASFPHPPCQTLTYSSPSHSVPPPLSPVVYLLLLPDQKSTKPPCMWNHPHLLKVMNPHATLGTNWGILLSLPCNLKLHFQKTGSTVSNHVKNINKAFHSVLELCRLNTWDFCPTQGLLLPVLLLLPSMLPYMYTFTSSWS